MANIINLILFFIPVALGVQSNLVRSSHILPVPRTTLVTYNSRCISQLFLAVVVLLLFPSRCFSIEIFVDQSASNSNCSNTKSNNPCNNLTASLKLIQNMNNSKLNVTSGVYKLPPFTNLIFYNVINTNFSVYESGVVQVVCSGPNSGIAFIQSININIEGFSFSGCGVEHKSTSRTFTSNNSFVPVMVALYFESCHTVFLRNVCVKQSQGLGIQFFSTTGQVNISGGIFSDNFPFNDLWGGGIYIEFPFCKPGDICNDNSYDPLNGTNATSYVIKDCVFRNNSADDSRIRYIVLAYHTNHRAPGRGGGLSVFFKGNASDIHFEINNCTFENNSAIYGAGIYMEMQDSSKSNSIYLSNSNFTNNYAKIQGGGVLASYLFLNTITGSEVVSGSMNLENIKFERNCVGLDTVTNLGKGGGLSFVTTKQSTSSATTANTFSISNSSFIENFAYAGSALLINSYSIEDNGYLYPIMVSNICLKGNFIQQQKINKPLGSGSLFVSHVPVKFNGIIKFIDNQGGTALAAFYSKLQVLNNTEVHFENNSGNDGGALALRSSSVIVVGNNVKLNFSKNYAFNRGGAIFADYFGPNVDIETQSCFIQYYDINSETYDWNASFVFRNNTIGEEQKSNSIYASSIQPCILGQPFGVIHNEAELMREIFCWNNDSKIWDYDDEDCPKHIDTGLYHFNQSSSPVELNVIPGKVTEMNLGGTDDQGDEIRSNLIVHAYSVNMTDGVTVDSAYAYISNDKIRLKNKNNVDSAIIELDTVGQDVTMHTKVNVTFLNCTPGFHLNNDGECVCSGTFGGVLKCDNATLTAYLLRGYWIGQAPCGYDSKTIVVSHCKYCDFKEVNISDGYFKLDRSLEDINKDLCGSKRNGHICSECEGDNAPAINLDQYSCVDCDKSQKIKGWFVFLGLDFFLPLVIIFGLCYIDVPLTNGLLHGPIFFAQMITTVISLDADDIIQYQNIAGNFGSTFEAVYTALYDIFNMEFLMFLQTFCLGLKHFADVLLLHYVTAFLPMIVVSVVGIVINCYSEVEQQSCIRNWKSKLKNLSNVLATCILLAYTKLAVLTCYLLTPISLVSGNGKFGDYSHSVLYVDGSICFPTLDYRTVISLIVALVFLIPIPIFFALFRSKETMLYPGFFNNLLLQFQNQFRQGKEDFDSVRNVNANIFGSGIQMESVFCDPCKVCGKTVIDNHTAYECECCTQSQLCSYYQRRSKCPIFINTSCSLYDFRWLSCFPFVLRIILILPYMLAWTTIIRYCLQLTICMFAGIVVLVVKPYKRNLYRYVDCNRVEAFSYLNLAFVLSLCIYQFHYSTTAGLKLSIWVYIIQCILVMAPFVWIVCVYLILVKERHRKKYKYMKRWFYDHVRRTNLQYEALDDQENGSESIPLSQKSSVERPTDAQNDLSVNTRC